MTADPPPRARAWSLLLMLVTLLVVALALYVGVQVISVLYGIVLPPLPPVPGSAREVSHENSDYGIDQWTYTTPIEVCEVLSFYEARGGVCIVAPGRCGRDGTEVPEAPAAAQCTGETPFSIFHMRWSTLVYDEIDQDVRLSVFRSVYWIGTGPTTTPRFRFDELSSSPNSTTEP